MIIFSRALAIGGLMAALPLQAVYAPIPEQEQGKDLTISLRAGLSYDSNIFGAANDAVDSTIWTLAPRVVYNASLTDQTFLAAAYALTLDRFDDRPGDKLLDSHEATVRLAHAFSKVTTIDINDGFTISRNPESLLAGRTVNGDQSFTRNQLDGRFTTPLNARLGGTVKARSVYLEYRDEELGRSLDRIENLFGASGDYSILPEIKAVGEYRHQDVFYRKLGELKNKKSDFLMGGVDYDVARKLSLTGRLGVEWRQRKAERDTTSPYAEVSAKYDYSARSHVVGGYIYTLEETSQPERFTDAKVHRLFANVQHAVTALIVASGSVTYEPSTLQGRTGFGNVSETTLRAGGALSYLPTKNWTTSASYDHDRVRSDDPSRKLRRERVALSATYTF
jgi:hypothetical protein